MSDDLDRIRERTKKTGLSAKDFGRAMKGLVTATTAGFSAINATALALGEEAAKMTKALTASAASQEVRELREAATMNVQTKLDVSKNLLIDRLPAVFCELHEEEPGFLEYAYSLPKDGVEVVTSCSQCSPTSHPRKLSTKFIPSEWIVTTTAFGKGGLGEQMNLDKLATWDELFDAYVDPLFGPEREPSHEREQKTASGAMIPLFGDDWRSEVFGVRESFEYFKPEGESREPIREPVYGVDHESGAASFDSEVEGYVSRVVVTHDPAIMVEVKGEDGTCLAAGTTDKLGRLTLEVVTYGQSVVLRLEDGHGNVQTTSKVTPDGSDIILSRRGS